MNAAALAMMVGEGSASATTFSDNFPTNGALGAPWVFPGSVGGITVTSNIAVGGPTENIAIVSTPTFGANQRVTITLRNISGGQPGIALRGNTSDCKCVVASYNSGSARFEAYLISSPLSYSNPTPNFSTGTIIAALGDTMTFEVTGNNYVVTHNVTPVLSFTDAFVANGQPGMRIYSAGGAGSFVATDI